MRAQQVPKPAKHPRPAGMKMPVPVGVTRAAAPSLRIAHDAQDARRIRLQHINNNHSNVTAKDPQTPCPRRCRARANTSQPRPNRSGDLAHQHGRVATGSAEHREVAAARGRVHTDNMRVVDQVIGVDNTEPLAVALEDRAQPLSAATYKRPARPPKARTSGSMPTMAVPVARQVFISTVSRAELVALDTRKSFGWGSATPQVSLWSC